ncbi:winged helix-turn-helix transcriptional regulator, partial [Candidatus Woesearchaeota archaeon]|nr:winged helix-turn-helix transcriptional regulator [Candidatus Woesearchaeota archaeon]
LNNVLLLTFFGMIISSACGFTLMDLLGRKDKKEIRETVISEMLPQEEREIIRLLEENGGAMKQSDLVKNSGLKKLKVSRIIKKLELMGVVKKYPHGITNKIALEKRISDDK